MSDDEIRTKTASRIQATDIVLYTVRQRRMKQTGDIRSSVQCQPRALRKAERDNRLHGKIDIREPCGLVRIVIEDIVRSRGAFHREEETGAKSPTLREKILDTGSGTNTYFQVLVAERGCRCTDAKVDPKLRRSAKDSQKQDCRNKDFFITAGFVFENVIFALQNKIINPFRTILINQ